jgi:NAD(P)-dependent dehydrogenase (short-subunit alcohol dehydrogenase family)
VEGLARSLAAEWSRNNIRVNVIAPSLTDTPMAGHLLSTEDKRKTSEDRHPIKRLGSPLEISKTVIHLLSEDSAWITGQTIHIDGGLSSLKPL